MSGFRTYDPVLTSFPTLRVTATPFHCFLPKNSIKIPAQEPVVPRNPLQHVSHLTGPPTPIVEVCKTSLVLKNSD